MSSTPDPVTLAGATLQWFNDHAAEGIFTTDTDTEVIAHLITREMDRGLKPVDAVGA